MQSEELARSFLDEMLSSDHSPKEHEKTVLRKGEFGILVYLTQHRDGANVGELTEYLRVTSGRTATALKTLEKKGYIRRQADSTDSRRICVYLTERGRAEFSAEHERAVSALTRLFDRLGEDDSREYVRILKKINLCR